MQKMLFRFKLIFFVVPSRSQRCENIIMKAVGSSLSFLSHQRYFSRYPWSDSFELPLPLAAAMLQPHSVQSGGVK